MKTVKIILFVLLKMTIYAIILSLAYGVGNSAKKTNKQFVFGSKKFSWR